MNIPGTVRTEILAFVDSVIGADNEVWLTGSRVRGDARPDSDWDVMVFFPMPPARQKIYSDTIKLANTRLMAAMLS